MTATLRAVDGEGLTLVIPAEVEAKAGLAGGAVVDVTPTPGGITANRMPRRRPTIEELVAGITPENCHGELDWGPPVGNEVW